MTEAEMAAREAVASATRRGWRTLDAQRRRDRVRGALLGLACGDALGAPFEGRVKVSDADVTLLEDSPAILRCSDDTAMTVVLAEHLADQLQRGGQLEEDRLLQALARAWRDQPWRGYGPVLPQVFRQALAGVSWRLATTVFGGGPHRNGGATRVAPVALCGLDLDHTLDWARRSAQVTHAHPADQAGAALQATAVLLAVTSDPARDIDPRAFVAALQACHGHPALTTSLHQVEGLLDETDPAHAARVLGHGIRATEAVPAAILAFLRSPDDPAAVVRFALCMGGDTDTIAAMAAAIAGARCGTGALPSTWRTRTDLTPTIDTAADRLVRAADSATHTYPGHARE